MNQQERNILAVTSLGHFLSHFNMLVFPAVVLPLAAALHLDLAAVLDLAFWHYLLFGITALPWGLVADRWGAKQLMLVFFLGAGICGLAAAYFIESPTALTLALAGIGFFTGIYHPAGLGLISKGITRLSMAMGYNGIFGNLGLASAPLVTGLFNWLWGPRGAFLALAGFNLAGFGLMLFMKITEPEDVHHAQAAEDGGKISPFLILLVAMMLGGVAYTGSTVILPTYFQLRGAGLYQGLGSWLTDKFSANLVAATLTSFIFLVGTFGQFVGGRVGERFEARKSYLFFHLLTLPPVFLLALTGDVTMVVLAVIYFFFLLGMQPIENTLVARLTPPRFHHSAYGAKFVLTFGVGSLAVKMVGGIERAWGITAVFPALGLVSVALVLTVLVLISRTSPVGGRSQ